MKIDNPDEISEVILAWIMSVRTEYRYAGDPSKSILRASEDDVLRLITLVRIGIAAKKDPA